MLRWSLSEDSDASVLDHVRDQIRLYRFQNAPDGLFTVDGSPADWQGLNIHLYDDEALIGALLGSTAWRTLHVNWLWVDAAHRHQGHARGLIDRAIAEAKSRGCVYAWGNVWQSQGAATLYDKLGATLMWRQEYPVEDHALLYYRFDFA